MTRRATYARPYSSAYDIPDDLPFLPYYTNNPSSPTARDRSRLSQVMGAEGGGGGGAFADLVAEKVVGLSKQCRVFEQAASIINAPE